MEQISKALFGAGILSLVLGAIVAISRYEPLAIRNLAGADGNSLLFQVAIALFVAAAAAELIWGQRRAI